MEAIQSWLTLLSSCQHLDWVGLGLYDFGLEVLGVAEIQSMFPNGPELVEMQDGSYTVGQIGPDPDS